MRRARIERFINAMADAHDLFLLREAFLHVGVHFVQRTDFLQHLDDAFIGAAVERAFRACRWRVVMAEYMSLKRRDGDAGAERGGVHAVIGMEHVAQIHGAFLFRRRLFAIDQVKEIGGFARGVDPGRAGSCLGDGDESRR